MASIGKSRVSVVKIAGAAAQLLWPASCGTCGALIENHVDDLCEKCWQDLRACCGADYCRRCGLTASRFAIYDGACTQCRDKQFNFDSIARAGIYTGVLSKAVLAFKHGRDEVAPILKTLAKAALASAGFENPPDQFVPVPLYWFRRVQRGFNQAHILARAICPQLNLIKCDLARTRNTPRQALLDAKDRFTNVRDAFAIRRGHSFKGKTICLVDDVKTTGSTLNECASLLKTAGAVNVYAVVIAVADPNFRDMRS
ncbi:MAG: hypothetical protein A2Y07_02175 [Planctomycetes bacterium GWF2_50_10]|nr:MAG: hypothetical protein A2Y07_02175 [Planctomycetes bacterium GWF2_50_10]